MSQQLKDLKIFYNDYYSKLVSQEDSIFYDGLSYVLAYEAIDMSSNIETNIQEHFINHLTKYINIKLNKKGRVKKIKKIQDTEIRKRKYQYLNKELLPRYNKTIVARCNWGPWVCTPSRGNGTRGETPWTSSCWQQLYIVAHGTTMGYINSMTWSLGH